MQTETDEVVLWTGTERPMQLLVFAGVVSLAGAAVSGCDRSNNTVEVQPSNSGSGQAGGESASQGDQASDSNRYSAVAEPTGISIDKNTEVTFRVQAGRGLKPNDEYPSWRFELNPTEGVKLAQTEFSNDDVELTGGEAVFRTRVNAEAAGEVTIGAVGNFSMCNEAKCHIMTDEKLSFVLEATDDES